jgi:hypothetical protein
LSQVTELSRGGRPGYLGEGIHVAASSEEELHTVGVGPFCSRMQGGEAFLQHMGTEVRMWGC